MLLLYFLVIVPVSLSVAWHCVRTAVRLFRRERTWNRAIRYEMRDFDRELSNVLKGK
jgi:hypothetical protein